MADTTSNTFYLVVKTPTSTDGLKNTALSVRVTPKMRFGLKMTSGLHLRPIPEIITYAIQGIFSSELDGGKTKERRKREE